MTMMIHNHLSIQSEAVLKIFRHILPISLFSFQLCFNVLFNSVYNMLLGFYFSIILDAYKLHWDAW